MLNAKHMALAASACVVALVGACGDDGTPASVGGGVSWSSGSTSTTSSDGGAGGGEPLPKPFAPYLGAHYDDGLENIDFRVASTRATRVELSIYDAPLGAEERLRVVLEREPSSDVWFARVPVGSLEAAGVTGEVYYGYRVFGPNWPYDEAWAPGSSVGFSSTVDDDGNRMNPNKLLIDPYAREISHDPTGPGNLDASIYGTDAEHRAIDTGPQAPKSIVVRPTDPVLIETAAERPTRPLHDDIVYEVHLRGLTRGDPSVGPCAGTYAGAAARADELSELGVTAIELLPVQETWNDTNDVDPASASGDNYWGYSTLAFFAPDRRYACDSSPGGPTRELREMTRAFHERGIKVFIDVVYNHTTEGGGGRLFSLRGLDNAAYYELDASGHGFADHTGIGANVNATHPLVRDLILDSLQYWSADLGVDGFRFDLASVLGNTCERSCFDFDANAPGNALLRASEELPARPADGGAGVDLIAEPWAIGPGTYQIGNFPPGWAEWNGQFRDLIRRDQNKLDVDDVTLGWLSNRLSGSPDLFADDGRRPGASVNFVVAHDGFTLRDLYACNAKDNAQAYPWGPSDGGSDDNLSWNHGGDAARQRQAARTGLALLMLSAGVPMITGGDEMLRTQQCNNNPYNLDTSAIWLSPADRETNAGFYAFARRLMAFRNDHPALRPSEWRSAPDITWHTPSGAILEGPMMDDPNAHVLAFRLDGVVAGDAARALYVVYNGDDGPEEAVLPPHAAETAWYLVLDTAARMEPEDNAYLPGEEEEVPSDSFDVAARSVVVFLER